ncbi:hypothetical protein AMJ85_03950 [candidate division BRC1 bacterium SM23_51]|nr:MAG: hypothetical protein AMJ85_03950 [candidate division BRC1 bacterium SM23_51]
MKGKGRQILLFGMLLGLVAGGWTGWALGERAVYYFGFLGQFFLTALKMLVLPLIVCSLISGVGLLGDIRRLGRTAAATLLYYFTTTALAVLIGIILVNVIRPGDQLREERRQGVSTPDEIARRIGEIEREIASLTGATDLASRRQLEKHRQDLEAERKKLANLEKVEQFERQRPGLFQTFQEILQLFVTPDLIRGGPATVRDGRVEQPPDMLAIIVFSIILGGLLTTIGAKGRLTLDVVDGLNQAIMRFVHLVILIAPIGIFGLVAAKLGETGGGDAVFAELVGLGRYALTVIVGLLVHGVIVLPLILIVLGRRNPLRYAGAVGQALVNAFSTASSGATLPLTLEGVERYARVRPEAARFVLPMGATVNMDGTALYEAVAVIFIAQAGGHELSFTHQAIIFLTASLAAIGAAAIPEAGLVTMLIVLHAVGLPAEGIGLILAIDWFLDRCRTTVNVWGDAVGAAVIERFGVVGDTAAPPAAEAVSASSSAGDSPGNDK